MQTLLLLLFYSFESFSQKCSPMARESRIKIPGRVIPKTQKIVLDATLLNTQYYKVGIKDKVEQSRERSSALSYILM